MFKTQINRLLLAVVLLNSCAVIGCHRGYYRRQADAEAQRLIRQKSVDPRWNTATGSIDIDPQSRMFDPFSADHPPIPPDDASSHQLMHCVDGKPGYPQWNSNGDTNYVENPEWRRYLPLNEKGQVVLTLDGAYQLALIHSSELQEAREVLYLSALDVSLERFGFDSRLDWGLNSFIAAANGSSTYRADGGWSLSRLGITGTQFAVGLANTVLFNFGGGNNQSGTSLINFAIVQPLLRDAGRDIIMESLTQSERTLLANVRQLERFRRGFYLQIAVGRNITARLSRAGVFLGIPSSASSNAGGYFGLLEDQQRIRNQELNVRQLEAVLDLFREFFLRERLDAVQLKSFETRVYGQQRRLLDLRTDYQTALDQFKRAIGLPPDLDVVIDDTYLDRFELISDQVNERLILTAELREDTGNVLNVIDNLFDDLENVDDIATGVFVWPTDLAEKISDLTRFVEIAAETLEKIVSEDREELLADFAKLDANRSSRLQYLNKLKTAIESGRIISPVDPDLFETNSIPESAELRKILSDADSKDSILNRASRVKQELAGIKANISRFKQTESELDKTQLYQYVLTEFQEKIPGQLSEINNLVLEISLLQARTRSNSIEIIDIDIEDTQAIEIARCMRRDWMNARASHVDNWRNIEFIADELESTVDLIFDGDLRSVGSHPFEFRYKPGDLRAGFRFDAPITRLAERNRYRAALIAYQQSRRDFYQFEDAVKRNLRSIKRNIDRNKVLFELDRRTVQVEIENVEINRYELEKPVGPGAQGGGRLGATTAQNLAQAIIGLNTAQNSFLRSWVEYEVLRRNLDFDMGTMQLDALGQWVDPGKIDASIGLRAAALIGIELDCQFCTGVVAPGGLAADLISDPAPSVIQPQPQTLPIETGIPDPVEIEGSNHFLFPQLNPPVSGMQPLRSVLSGESASLDRSPSRTPELLFSPVNSKTGSTIQVPAVRSVSKKQTQSKQVTVPATSAIAPLANRPMEIAEPQLQPWETAAESSDVKNELKPTALKPNKANPTGRQPLMPNRLEIAIQPDHFQPRPETIPKATHPIDPVSNFSNNPVSTDLISVDLIANPFSDPLVRQTSGTSSVTRNQQAFAPSISSNQPSAQNLKAETESFEPIPALDSVVIVKTTPVPSPNSGLTSNLVPGDSARVESDWQSRPATLGGVLNRFRTKSDK